MLPIPRIDDPTLSLINTACTLKDRYKCQASLACLNKAIILNPSNKSYLLEKIQILQALRWTDEIIKTYNVLTNMFYTDCWLNHKYARFLKFCGRYEDALAQYDKTLSIAPNTFKIYFEKVELLISLKRRSDALECITHILTQEITDANDYCKISSYLKRLHKHEEALEFYNRATDIRNRSFSCCHQEKFALLIQLERFEDAISHYNHIKMLDQVPIKVYYDKANLLQKLGRYDEAIELYDFIKEMSYLESMCCCVEKVDLLIKLGRFEQALEVYDEIIGLNVDNRYSYRKAELLMVLKREKEAVKCLDDVVDLNIGKAEYYSFKNAEFFVRYGKEDLACKYKGNLVKLSHFGIEGDRQNPLDEEMGEIDDLEEFPKIMSCNTTQNASCNLFSAVSEAIQKSLKKIFQAQDEFES